MEEKQIKEAFDTLNPSQNQKEQMKQRFLDAANGTVRITNKNKSGSIFRKVASIAIILLGLTGAGVITNQMTDGKVVQAMQRIFHFNQGKQDVTGQIEAIPERGIEVYAPDILAIDEETVIFGSIRGLVIYDRKQNQIAGTIDLQAIDCIYFNSDNKNTCVVKDGTMLTIFNTQDNAPIGSYYQYDIANINGEELQPTVVAEEKAQMDILFETWKESQKQYVDVFDTFCEIGLGNQKINPNDAEMYSQKGIKWSSEGVDWISYLLVEDGVYLLEDYDVSQKQVSEKQMVLEQKEESTEQTTEIADDTEVTLPEFIYAGDDEAIAAIWEYFEKEDGQYYQYDNAILMPGFIIYKQVQEGDELLVFGNYWLYTYLLNGNVFEEQSGGECPACVHLKKVNGAYEVVAVDRAGDGAEYDLKIKEFTDGYEGVYDMYIQSGMNNDRQDNQKYYLQMYVKENDLDIQYFKEYGWDPVPIMD
ncbi:MAG: hypothetical protein Q4D51_00150 [Eubacteriales bacterium]|nr:hypothetical protein [Eubacteriales bacterium]